MMFDHYKLDTNLRIAGLEILGAILAEQKDQIEYTLMYWELSLNERFLNFVYYIL